MRFTALHGLGQLANDQSPHFQETSHQQVMPVLTRKMDDQVDRVASMAMSAFVSFGEELDNSLMAGCRPCLRRPRPCVCPCGSCLAQAPWRIPCGARRRRPWASCCGLKCRRWCRNRRRRAGPPCPRGARRTCCTSCHLVRWKKEALNILLTIIYIY